MVFLYREGNVPLCFNTTYYLILEGCISIIRLRQINTRWMVTKYITLMCQPIELTLVIVEWDTGFYLGGTNNECRTAWRDTDMRWDLLCIVRRNQLLWQWENHIARTLQHLHLSFMKCVIKRETRHPNLPRHLIL